MAELHSLLLVKGAMVANILVTVRGSMADINVTCTQHDDGDDFRDGAHLDGLIPYVPLCIYVVSYCNSSDTLRTLVTKYLLNCHCNSEANLRKV